MAAVALGLAGVLIGAQSPPTRAEVEAHKTAVLSERLVRFLDDYEARDEAVRKLAWKELERRRPTGSGVAAGPTLESLYFAWRQLLDDEGEGGELAETVEMQRLAAALDLVVTPGVFAARAEGLGEALTVHVRPITPVTAFAPKNDFFLALEWITPIRAQERARREPIGPAALREGFDMYLRAPPSQPGTWQLFGMAARDEAGSIAGHVPAVRVDCIGDLAQRVERAWQPRDGEPAGRAHLRRAFELLQHFGLRTTPSLGGARLLETIEGWSSAEAPPETAVPLEVAFTDASGAEHWLWCSRPSAQARGTLLLLGSQRESVDTAFAGGVGAAWRDVARRFSLRLCATHVPHDLHAIQPLLERERARAEGQLIVVVRGDTLGRFGAVMQGREDPPFDALVLSGVIASSPPDQLFRGVERLLVAPAADTGTATDDQQLTWIAGDFTPLFNEPRLPELVASWLTRRNAAREAPR